MASAVRNVVIIGSGPAGLTACIYAARANLKPLCIEGFNAGGLIPGGQLMFTTDVENYPGFPEKVTGQELMQRFRDQAEHQGTEIITADVTKVDLSKRPFKVWVGDDERAHLAEDGDHRHRRARQLPRPPERRQAEEQGRQRVRGVRRRALSRRAWPSSAAATPRWKRRATSPASART